MPFSALPLFRPSLCAQCARAARRAASTASARGPARSSSSSAAATTTTTARPLAAPRAALPVPARGVASTARTAAPTRSQPAPAPSAPAADAPPPPPAKTAATPSFYALFPQTLRQGPPPAGPFAIDLRALKAEFLQRQAAAHPDFHHAGTAATGRGRDGHSTARARAEALSSLLNEAYRTLASPLLRAQYLLRQAHGIDLDGDESTVGAAAGARAMDLLMAVLEVREDIEQARTEADLEPLRAANDARMRESEAALAAAFAADDVAAARREAVRLRYWVNIDDALRNWERGKDIVLEH